MEDRNLGSKEYTYFVSFLSASYLLLGPLLYWLSLQQVASMTFYYGSPAVHIIVFLPTPAFFVYHILGLSMIYLGIAIVMRQIGKPGKDVLFRILLPTMLPWPVLGFDISLGWALDVPHLVPYGIFMWYHMLCFFQLILFILSILFTLGEFFRERNSSTQQ